ncbi:putative pectinesterase [Helianthus annuus]|nr:putative pectinesterase [Helianthus annuus]
MHAITSQMTTSTLLLLTTLTFLSTTFAAVPPPSSASTICQYTPYPSFCRSTIPINNSTANVHDYGRFSVRKSISAALKFSALIDKYLRRSSILTTGAIRALQDCQYLAGVNVDFLQNTFQTVDKTQTALSTMKSEDIQTMLSAILTNTQTCIDGIQATASSWSSKNGVLAPLANDNKLYSVSLSLFNRGWGAKNKKTRSSRSSSPHKKLKNGRLPLKMSEQAKAVFETVGRRNLLQTDDGGDQVVISDIVVVSQDGSGNFSNIMDAVNIAPNKTKAEDGYFLIYVTAGVYEEYVNIPKNKYYLMIIGDGINQTVITGNRNVVDGWTTFNSATFSKSLVVKLSVLFSDYLRDLCASKKKKNSFSDTFSTKLILL